jgi:tetratricopeptide (TPR) repeat protein
MPDETESGASLLARREYARAVPLLKRDLDKYQSNPRIRLQYADALAGAGEFDEAIAQYEQTAKYYNDNGLTVQAIAVAKKAEKIRVQNAASKPQEETAGKSDPLFTPPVPKSPLFEVLSEEERNALVREMELESHDEGSVIISEGQPGASMYIIASGEVKVFTHGAGGATVYLARLGEGDFFGEVSMLSGKPRTATVTAGTDCDLLELDRLTLDAIGKTKPHVFEVLQDFAALRGGSARDKRLRESK